MFPGRNSGLKSRKSGAPLSRRIPAAARALFLDRLLPCGYCLSGSVGGRPVTMAFLLPAELETGTAVLPLQYIFAAATLPACRGGACSAGCSGRRWSGQGNRELPLPSSVRPSRIGGLLRALRISALLPVGGRAGEPGDVPSGGALPAGGFALLEDERNAAAFRNAALEGHPVWVRWPDELAAWPPTRPFYPAAEPLPERAASLCANRREIRCLSGIGAAGRRRKGTPRGGGGALSPAGNRAFPLRPRRGRGAPSAGFVR